MVKKMKKNIYVKLKEQKDSLKKLLTEIEKQNSKEERLEEPAEKLIIQQIDKTIAVINIILNVTEKEKISPTKQSQDDRRYPRIEDIKTIEDMLKDIDKKMIFKIFEGEKPLKSEEKLFEIASKIGRILQYIKILTEEILKIKNIQKSVKRNNL